MRTVETTDTVAPDGTLTVQVPPDVTPGIHQIVSVIDESRETRERQLSAFPVVSVGAWPSDLSLRRKDMYGDAGRRDAFCRYKPPWYIPAAESLTG